jgi:hypothetical protein
MTDLGNIKAGDEVVVYGIGGKVLATCTVDRVTKTLVVCGSYRYRLSDGYETGVHRFIASRIVPATPELIEQARAAMDRVALVNQVEMVQWGEVPAETLEKVLALVNGEGATND